MPLEMATDGLRPCTPFLQRRCLTVHPHLCHTESGSPSKGKSYTGLGKKCRLMKTVQTMKGHGNYQNCPVMRPHTPHSSYGTYVTLAPKVLVFPVFVQVS